MKNDEDEMIIDYCLICNSRINDNDDVVLQNSNMQRFGNLEVILR